MATMESGQTRAAYLMDAARRNHFVSRIQKYEAKVRQSKLKEQKEAMALPVEQRPGHNGEEQQPPEKTLVPEKVVLGIERIAPQRQLEREHKAHRQPEKVQDVSHQVESVHKGCSSDKESHRSYGREDSPETRIFSERKEILPGMLQRSSSVSSMSNQNMRTVIKGYEGLCLGNGVMNADTDKIFHMEMAAPQVDVHDRVYVELKPPVSADVDIAAVAGALKIKIKAADMAPVMQEHAFRCARECLDSMGKLQSKQIAHTLKKEFDSIYGPAWHCIVGTSFGSYVTHSLGGFVYFSLEKVSVLLFKTTVEPIEN